MLTDIQLQVLRKKMREFGHSIDDYTPSFTYRRLLVRKRVCNIEGDEQYINDLNRDESLALKDELLINVTHLFRDLTPFTYLRDNILDKLPATPRIWSAGCSNGSEAATLAMLCAEKGLRPTILGTDKDFRIIEAANKFTFDPESLKELPAEYKKYLTQTDAGFVLKPELQQYITFKQGDILAMDIPKSDLIFCRNTVIYFHEEVKKKFYMKIYDALEEGKFFVIGRTETLLGDARTKFTVLSPKERVYQK